MAVPANPTVTSIVTQALKRAGRTTPTATQIQEAIDHALQEVKADIMLLADTHPSLLATATSVTTRGLQRYATPDDYNQPYSLMLLDGPEDWRGLAQSAAASTITLASTFSASADEIMGRYLLITGGPGLEEYRQIIGYNASTKVVTVEAPWLSNPSAESTYLIVSEHIKLYPNDTAYDYDQITYATTPGRPELAATFGLEYLLWPVPDLSTYGLLNRYFVDLSKLDESEELFIQLLREWRSLWIQGVAVKSMQRFDEDRYQSELSVYKLMLDSLASQTCTVRPSRYMDV